MVTSLKTSPKVWRLPDVLAELRNMADSSRVRGMERFGINDRNALGISIPQLRKLASKIRKNHMLAAEIWSTGIHEARILAAYVEDPAAVTSRQMDDWAQEFDSWDICDQVCCGLFCRTAPAWKKTMEWSRRQEEFVKRAAFVLMASLAVHDKRAVDEKFLKLFPVIEREASDERNFVKKAVNWALRQIGKRNLLLNQEALKTAEKIADIDSSVAKWIARDAIRELTGEPVQLRLKEKEG